MTDVRTSAWLTQALSARCGSPRAASPSSGLTLERPHPRAASPSSNLTLEACLQADDCRVSAHVCWAGYCRQIPDHICASPPTPLTLPEGAAVSFHDRAQTRSTIVLVGSAVNSWNEITDVDRCATDPLRHRARALSVFLGVLGRAAEYARRPRQVCVARNLSTGLRHT
ncbi:MAG: hypothetical protein ACJAYU_003280 [Bradymonadia bacterium]|jgi:hypothetical protein